MRVTWGAAIVAGMLAAVSPLEPPARVTAADGDVSQVAGGQAPMSVFPTAPTQGDQVGFSVYATNIDSRDGFLYVRDYAGIVEIDADTGLTRRIAGLDHLQTEPAIADGGVRADSVAITWTRSLAVGPDRAVYFDSYTSTASRLYRIDPLTNVLTVVAGDGTATAGGEGVPGASSGLASVLDGIHVDDSSSLWFVEIIDPASPTPTLRLRRVDGSTGLISTMYVFETDPLAPVVGELVGVTPDGSAFVFEATYDETQSEVVDSRMVRVDADGTEHEVSRAFSCPSDPFLFHPSGRKWIDRGVVSVLAGDMLCWLDLTTGAVGSEPIAPAMSAEMGRGGLLENALTTAADGSIYFLSKAEATYPIRVMKWARSNAGPDDFVRADGTRLTLGGEPFQFTGLNFYQANNEGLCATPVSDAALEDALDAIGPGGVLRAWFFQSLATTPSGRRDWTEFDRTLQLAAARGVRVIPTLVNQLVHCDGPAGASGQFKGPDWYSGGYRTAVPPGTSVPYLTWVTEIGARYAQDPTILAWQLINEAEVATHEFGPCAPGAAGLLRDFAAEVSTALKAVDSNHLVSLGTIGGGQCGASHLEYATLHGLPTLDLCEVHDYQQPRLVLPGDKFNGLAFRLDQCRALDKPLFIGESGIKPSELSPATFAERAAVFDAKITGQLQAGVVGVLAWNWEPGGSAPGNYDIGPGDPVLDVLRAARPKGGGDVDGDGVVNAIDVGSSAFDDGDGTTGAVADAAGLDVTVLDAFGSDSGVRVSVASPATDSPQARLSMCGTTVLVNEGTEATLGCGSIDVSVSRGSVTVVVAPGRTVTVGAGSGASIAFTADGTFTVSAVTGSGVVVRVGSTTTPVAPGSTATFSTAPPPPVYRFVGFAAPVGNTSSNSVNSGQTVPLKWQLLDSAGRPVTTLTSATIRLRPCSGGGVETVVDFTRTSGLQSHGNGRYQIDWKTSKTDARSCKVLGLDLGDGVTHDATFAFVK